MRLQIRDQENKGARKTWRDILSFDVARLPEIEDAAACLARASGQYNMRIVADNGVERYLNEFGAFRVKGNRKRA